MRRFFPVIRRLFYIVILAVFLIALSVMKNNSETCESMTRGVVRSYNRIFTSISGFIGFVSLTELLFIALSIICIAALVFAIIAFVRREFVLGSSRLLIIPVIVLLVVADYSFSCELAYNRKEIPLPYYETEVSRTDYVSIYNYFADDLNYCIAQRTFLENGDVEGKALNKITKEVKEAYKIIEGDDYYHPYFGSVKSMLSSFLYREFQITGVTFNPLGEANINVLNTHADIPFTVAHELAHTKGVMREDDANQLAFYICLNSDSPYLRYSAYTNFFYQLQMIASTSYLTKDELAECHKVNVAYSKTVYYEYTFWKEHDLLTHIGDFFNNLYIKSSGVKEGTNSYAGGTDFEFDPTTNKLYPSLYQKLFFEKYYHQ